MSSESTQPVSDPLLSLDDDTVRVWRRSLGFLALALHEAVIASNAESNAERMGQWMRDPQIGDYVIEWDTMKREESDPDGDWYRGFGKLVEITGKHPDETWHVQYGPA